MSWVAAAVVGAAAIGAGASYLASKSQGDAAKDAASSSAAAAKYQTDVQRQIFEQIRSDQTPWREAGTGALSQLSQGLGLDYTPTVDKEKFLISPKVEATYRTVYKKSGGSVLGGPAVEQATPEVPAKYDEAGYQAAVAAAEDARRARRGSPTFGALARPFAASDFEADPGYAFRQAEGMKAIERSAAARGGALSGGAVRGATRFGQGLASEEYGNAFNRYQTTQANAFNRLASLAGLGQTANAATGQAGSNYANAVTGISQADATNQGNALLAAGNARASGYQGIGNAIASAPSNYFLLSSLRR